MGEGIGCDVSDSIALGDAERLEGGRPSVDSVAELRVGQPRIPINDSFALGVQLARSTKKLERRQR
jgi:hypothetical protein